MAGVEKFPLHRAVIQRNILEVETLLEAGVDINERDAAGIPALHYAIHLGYIDIMSFLLKKGADITRKSAAGWSALQEAIAVRSKMIVKDVMIALQRKVNIEYERRIPALLELLRKLPDFYMELKWEFHSWVPLVSRLCPSDNYKIYKHGANFRVDTTLVGFENMKWSRGDLSFVFKGEENGGVIYVLDHKDHNMEKIVIGEAVADTDISDKEITDLLSSTTLVKTSPVMDNVVFTPTKTWLGYEKTEKIGEDQWSAKVYEVTGFDLKMLNRHRVKKSDSTPQKTREEITKELLEKSITPVAKPQGLLFENETISEKLKSFKGTVWISEEFPRTTQELLPIFELLAPTQKHFQKLNTFISLKMPSAGFPVKVDIPVFPTVSGTATFTRHEAKPIDPKLFDIPPYPLKRHQPKKDKSATNSPATVNSPSGSSHGTPQASSDAIPSDLSSSTDSTQSHEHGDVAHT